MNKLAAILLCVGLFGLSVFAQSNRATRPRVAPSPTPTPSIERTPPVLQNDTTLKDSAKRPPVLKGGSQPAPTPTPQTAENAEVIEDDGEIIKVETNLVTFPVSVLDRDGRFISGLQQKDFQIYENGIEQRIELFQSVEQPFTVVLLLDVSPSTQYKINEIQDAAIAFVNQLRRDDKVVVISFDERINVLSRATSDRSALRSAIQRAQFGDGTSLYEAVDYALNRELRNIQGRKAVVLFTDGVDTTSSRANYQSTVRIAEESEALIYPIRYDTYQGGGNWGGTTYPSPAPRRRSGGGWGGILGDILGGVVIGGNNYPTRRGGGAAGSSSEDYATGKRYLEELARNSGGRAFEANRNLDAAFSGIAEELRRQYSIGYYPEKEGQIGERRSIRVRVMRPNLVVRAKNSYIVGQNDNQKFAGK